MSAVGVARGRRLRGGVQGGYVVWAGVAVGACGHSVDSMVGVFRRDFWDYSRRFTDFQWYFCANAVSEYVHCTISDLTAIL